MIILAGKNPAANILHVLAGPETDFWTQLHGAAAVDLTPVLNQMDPSQPIFLHLTRCQSEHDMAARINAQIQMNGEYPFVPPTFVFTPKTAQDAGQVPSPQTTQQPMYPMASAPAAPDVPGVVKPTKVPVRGKCQRCLNTNVELVPKLMPGICYSCVRIDLHIAKEAKAEQPPSDDVPLAESGGSDAHEH